MLILPRRWLARGADMGAREKSIVDRLSNGRLPRTKPVTSRASFGRGLLCDGCTGPILPREVEQQHDVGGGVTLRFHATCAEMWERMIAALPAPG